MTDKPSRDDVPGQTSETPAKPLMSKVKPKASPAPTATKAQIAAHKRMDKTVIKRMRKR